MHPVGRTGRYKIVAKTGRNRPAHQKIRRMKDARRKGRGDDKWQMIVKKMKVEDDEQRSWT